MEGKGIIRFFLIALAVVCVLQYLYMLPTRSVEGDAERFAEDVAASAASDADRDVIRKEARLRYLDSMSSEPIVKLPLLPDYTYEDLKARQLAFGLDLKGGLSAVLQVNLADFIRTLSKSSKDPTFQEALKNASTRLKTAQVDYVTLFAEEWAKVADGKKLAPIFSRNAALRDDMNFETPDDEVIRVLREKADQTVKLTFSRLKDRIDRFGVIQPNVSLDEARDLILVELPGVENSERARKYLSASAELGFWNVYPYTNELQNSFVEADRLLKARQTGDSTQAETELLITPVYDINYDETGNPIDSTFVRNDTVELEADPFANVGPLLKLLTLNGQGGIGYGPHIAGIADKNKRDAIDRMLADPEVRELFPEDVMFLWDYKPFQDQTGQFTRQYLLNSIRLEPGLDGPPIDGDVVVGASAQPNPTSGQVEVSLQMDGRGAQAWGQMTTEAAPQRRSIAIVLDSAVVSAPTVNEPIMGGNSSISGSFSLREGEDLANILEIGKLPAKTDIIQESVIGPSLGAQNITRSFNSLMIGLILLVVFMLFYYARGGVVAIIALIANLFFIFGALGSLGTVLTLPGIAGILLTIGMAVDANVIIFERIREELRSGKTMLTAIADGFKYSYSAIIDANVTTILVAIVLAYFGLGPIKGFAVVLIIGVISSLVTAVLMGRLLIDWWTDGGREMSFWTGASKNVLANLNFDWLSKRKMAYVISGVLLLASVGSILTRGFEYGVDFKGGYKFDVAVEESTTVSIDQLRDALTASFDGAPTTVKAVDLANTYSVTTSYLIEESSEEAQKTVTQALLSGINGVTGENVTMADFLNTDGKGSHISASSKVGPTIADDIKRSSYLAAFVALLLIFVYILFRFRKWQYSLGAVAALFHDSIIVLGFFSLFHGLLPFSMEIDQAFIAALLTVIGYSINDTVVVFDRIREFLGIYVSRPKTEVVNMAINSTFSRTVITSLTTMIVVLILFIFGGSSIKGFAFALLVGILVGTYSSIFVATPIVHDLTDEMATKTVAKKRKPSKART